MSSVIRKLRKAKEVNEINDAAAVEIEKHNAKARDWHKRVEALTIEAQEIGLDVPAAREYVLDKLRVERFTKLVDVGMHHGMERVAAEQAAWRAMHGYSIKKGST